MWRCDRTVAAATAAWLLLRSLVARPAPPARVDHRRIFVGGCARSGTSWVRDMFHEHPQVITDTEAHVWRDIFEPLHRSGRGLRGWATLLQRDAAHRARRPSRRLPAWIDRRTFHRLICWAMREPGSADEVAEALISAVLDHYVASHSDHEHPVLVEKTPANIFYADRILRRYPDARFVEVRRDGRDVLVSMSKIAHRGKFPKDRPAQVAAWVGAVQAGLALENRDDVADRVLLVRYEELKADPAEGIKRLWDFAGLDYVPEQVAAAVDATSFEALQQTKRTGDGEFRRKGVVGDWVEHLDEHDLAVFREAAASTLVAAGYSL